MGNNIPSSENATIYTVVCDQGVGERQVVGVTVIKQFYKTREISMDICLH